MTRIITETTLTNLLAHLTKNNTAIPRIILMSGELQNRNTEEKHTFCQALASNTTLRHLDMRGNKLDAVFLNDIKNALISNMTLEELLFDSDSHNEHLVAELESLLERNRVHVLTQPFVPQPEALFVEFGDPYFDIVAAKYLTVAIELGNPHGIYRLIQEYPDLLMTENKYNESLLHMAVEEGQIQCVKALLQLGFPATNLDTPLLAAVKQNDLVLAALMLKSGASTQRFHNGSTVLHKVSSVKMAKLLIEYGADPFTVVGQESINYIHGSTLLHSLLAKQAEPDLIHYLLNLKIPVNVQNNGGMTALHLLSLTQSKTPESLKQNINLLLTAGANPLIKDALGKTPLAYARLLNKNISLWEEITRDFQRIQTTTPLIKQIARQNGFFGAPPEVIERIALMANAGDSLEQECCDILTKRCLRN